jgi:hypothetical protein
MRMRLKGGHGIMCQGVQDERHQRIGVGICGEGFDQVDGGRLVYESAREMVAESSRPHSVWHPAELLGSTANVTHDLV